MDLTALGESLPTWFDKMADGPENSGAGGAMDMCLDRVEHFLIRVAVERNPNLVNVKKVEWSTQSAGRTSESSHQLRRTLGL